MGEYVTVKCGRCGGVIGDGWVEEITEPVTVIIEAGNGNTCECMEKYLADEVDNATGAAWQDGYDEGLWTGRHEPKE